MSLRDQLLKAGLVTEDQVKQVESEGKKKRHTVKKNKQAAKQQKSEQAEQRRQRQAEQVAKREQDRRLNAEREAVKRRRENAARIRQMLKDRRLNDPQAEIPYNFSAGKVVRRVRVTLGQQRQLAQGKLGIVRNPNDEFDFPIVPRQTAETLAAIDPRLVVLLYDLNSKPDDDDWDWPE